jgi:hypothetical protein
VHKHVISGAQGRSGLDYPGKTRAKHIDFGTEGTETNGELAKNVPTSILLRISDIKFSATSFMNVA